MENTIKKIGFIGVGVMGKSMVRNLMKAGYELSIYSRTKSKCLDVIEEGARWFDTAAECSKGQDVIITMVGFPKDVEEVYFGDENKAGILKAAKKGAILVDMTTSSPRLAEKIYEEAKKNGQFALDAPVSGGDSGAKKGTLTIMVGGDRDVYEKLSPVFSAMGTNNTYEGRAGFGQHTKAVNQIVIAGTIAGISEAVNYAEKNGLDVKTVLDSISKGAAGSWQLENNAPKMLDHYYDPGFYIKHFIKDMNIALEEAALAGARMPVTKTVIEMYKEMDARGKGNLGTQSLIKYYRDEE